MLALLAVDVEHHLRRYKLVRLQREVTLLQVLQSLSYQEFNREMSASGAGGRGHEQGAVNYIDVVFASFGVTTIATKPTSKRDSLGEAAQSIKMVPFRPSPTESTKAPWSGSFSASGVHEYTWIADNDTPLGHETALSL